MSDQNCCFENGQKQAQISVVMVPLPAQSHLNQLLHLTHLLTTFDIPVYYTGSSTHNQQTKLRLQGRDSNNLTNIHFHDFELPPHSSPPPPNPNHKTTNNTDFPAHLQPVWEAFLHLRQPIYELIKELATKYRRVVVIHDSLVASVVQDVKFIINAEAYTLVPVSAFNVFFASWQSIVEKPFELDFDDIQPCHVPSMEGCITPEMLEFIMNQMKFLDFQSGKLYNTNRLIEGRYVELLERLSMVDGVNMKHFAIGPFHPVEMRSNNEKERHVCLQWLDKQEPNSVIYVSFGSTVSLSDEQNEELAKGLERSGQKFIWVVRYADKGDIFEKGETRLPQLPEGYETRVKVRGMVVKNWAPQLQILAHQSTGGFMSHCGWNSCLESISMGVPIATWPMHSDQPKNAVFVKDVLKTGVMVRNWEKREEVVMSSVIEEAVRRLMASKEGEEMRKRASEIGDKIKNGVAKGGAIDKERKTFIAHITR